MTNKVKQSLPWIITWQAHSAAPTCNFPGTRPGHPLAVFPGNASKGRIEGAMTALFQMISGSTAEVFYSYTGRSTPFTVEWDFDGMNAKIGHDIEVRASRSTATIDLGEDVMERTNGTGEIEYSQLSKWSTNHEWRRKMNIS